MIPTDMARDATARPAPQAPADPGRWTVLYDSDCGFCRWSLALVLARDTRRRLRPLPLDSAEADRLLSDLSPEARAASWHLVAPDGSRSSAGRAAPRLLALLSGGRAPAAVLAAVPRLTDRAYWWVADHRSWFSRLVPERAKGNADRKIAEHSDRG
jgi:predicted DCC family thiol-disulfide oxidoreductase YuxK